MNGVSDLEFKLPLFLKQAKVNPLKQVWVTSLPVTDHRMRSQLTSHPTGQWCIIIWHNTNNMLTLKFHLFVYLTIEILWIFFPFIFTKICFQSWITRSEVPRLTFHLKPYSDPKKFLFSGTRTGSLLNFTSHYWLFFKHINSVQDKN